MAECWATYFEGELSANAVSATNAVRDETSLTFLDQQSVRGLTDLGELFLEGGTIRLRPTHW